MAGPLVPISFAGRPIYPFPASPAFSEVSFSMSDSVAVTQSPWSMKTQTQLWQGADYWTASVTLPPMPMSPTGRLWLGWAGVLRGKLGMFFLSDPLRLSPVGVPQGTPTVMACAVGSTIIPTRGWNFSQNNLLVVGDLIQIGYRLHEIVGNDTGGNVDSDVNGYATVEIWPSTRDVISEDVPIIWENPKGLFMLSSSIRTWSSVASEQLVGMSFKCQEAR